MDFDLKYDEGVLVHEFFLQESMKDKNVCVRFLTHRNLEDPKCIVWVINPQSSMNTSVFPLRDGKIIALDDICTPKDRKKTYVIVAYKGFIDDCFTYKVRRTNIIERVIGFFTIK